MKRSGMILAGAIVLVAGAGAYAYASPLLALNGMKSAVEARDAAALSGYIDFAELRADIKSEARAAMMAEAAKSKDPMASAGMALGGALVDQMVDNAVTPEGVKMLMAKGAAAGGAPKAAAKLQENFSAMEIERKGLSEFNLRNPKDPKAAVLQFRRDGLSWKLVGIDVPPEALAAPAPGQ